MLATLIIVFREIIEAGLVVGIVLAATRGVPRRGLWVGYGILGGIAGACGRFRQFNRRSYARCRAGIVQCHYSADRRSHACMA